MTNFIPNDIKRIILRDPTWISKQLKSKLNKKIAFMKTTKRTGTDLTTKYGLTDFARIAIMLSRKPKPITSIYSVIS